MRLNVFGRIASAATTLANLAAADGLQVVRCTVESLVTNSLVLKAAHVYIDDWQTSLLKVFKLGFKLRFFYRAVVRGWL